MDVTYPPEPWHLTGHCLIGVFLVPAAAAPAPPLPTGARTLTVFGRTIVATAFFVYERPSPLTYNEIMSTTVSVRRLLPFVSIPFIQVDSPASRAGGRELWAIPKELNRFAVRRLAEYTAKAVGTARLPRPPRWALPPLPIAFRLLQGDDRAGARTPVAGLVRVRPVRAEWEFDGAGPLAHLAGRRPLLSVAVPRFRLRFGGRRTRRW
ncbi:hypothetical protein AXK57_07860 [Tsukamurella pulmonis]|uniref:acetoacetate decarboxylase family protein n=2 Tax=Tsukamurella pulmonis TaxID=47312 RepID=UPI000792118F|nr:acetoacetate decarboxylase family protein [Tsukamurella pulmonis]KXP11253.1 hypothetical protein AXK57_07860 [Tsukamurella pulmonis]